VRGCPVPNGIGPLADRLASKHTHTAQDRIVISLIFAAYLLLILTAAMGTL